MQTLNLEVDWDGDKMDKFMSDKQLAKNMADGEDGYYSEWKLIEKIKKFFKKLKERKEERKLEQE